MSDIVDRATRSRMMSGIRGKDTKPERVVRRFLHASGLRYRLHQRNLPGTPDLVLAKHSAVVLVHGCFWHQHPGCPQAVMPRTNRDFWRDKLEENRSRDERYEAELRALGYRVFVVWECELRDDRLDQLASAIRNGATDSAWEMTK
jgi:DNA mismatch endonuclease, patch repair protein